MSAETWGAGDKSQWNYLDERGSFDSEATFRLFRGEHPHSRSDKDLYAELPGFPDVVAFDGHRIRTRIDLRESNYLKSSELSGSEIRKHCQALVYFNDRLVYGRTHREVTPLLLWCATHLSDLYEHPVNLVRGEPFTDELPTVRHFPDLIGRGVYHDGVPGVVTRYFPTDGAVVVEACKGHEFVTPAHIVLRETEERRRSVKADLLSESIWWFRNA